MDTCTRKWKFTLPPAGYFNSRKDYNLGGSVAYQGEKYSFTTEANSSVNPSGEKKHEVKATLVITNNDGRNFQICGGLQVLSFGPGYKQHTDSQGTSYNTPGGINVDVQYGQTNDSFGNKGHNLGGSVAYQGEKNSFMIGAHSSVYSSGAKSQTFNGAYSTKNNDGSNFQIRGKVQVSNLGHSYKQRTKSLGGSYTTPGGINFDIRHNQKKDTFGNKMKSHAFRSGLKINANTLGRGITMGNY